MAIAGYKWGNGLWGDSFFEGRIYFQNLKNMCISGTVLANYMILGYLHIILRRYYRDLGPVLPPLVEW